MTHFLGESLFQRPKEFRVGVFKIRHSPFVFNIPLPHDLPDQVRVDLSFRIDESYNILQSMQGVGELCLVRECQGVGFPV